jgi:hypothetical protein
MLIFASDLISDQSREYVLNRVNELYLLVHRSKLERLTHVHVTSLSIRNFFQR